MPRRSELKLRMMMRKPVFSSPMRFAAGTRQASNLSVAVSEHHQPIFLSSKRVKPGRSRSMSSSDTPAAPGPPVLTATV